MPGTVLTPRGDRDGQRRGRRGTYVLRGGDVAVKTGCDGAVSQQCFVKLLPLLVLVCSGFFPLCKGSLRTLGQIS